MLWVRLSVSEWTVIKRELRREGYEDEKQLFMRTRHEGQR